MTPTSALRLADTEQAARLSIRQGSAVTPARPRPPRRQVVSERLWWSREAMAWTLLAAALHALVVAGLWRRPASAHPPPAVQDIELVRPPPEQRVEPPPPPPPTPQLHPPPQAVAPPRPALRTAAATAPVADSVSLPENLQAAPTTGPVEAAAPAPVPAPVKAEEPVTEPSANAAYLNNPPPTYPKAAQRQGWQGRVLLRVHVLAGGQPGTVEIRQSSGKTLLDEAAVAAVRNWTFVPGKKGSTPVDGWTTVPIDFKLAP